MITIIVHYGSLIVKDGKEKGARLVWRAPGLDVFVKGSLSEGNLFESAGNLAVNACIARHIPTISLRYQKGSKNEQKTSRIVTDNRKTLF